MAFTGQYEHTIDAKQRLAIPAEIRSRLDPERHGSAFYMVPGPNGAIWLWPERQFEQLSNAMERTLIPGVEIMDYEEWFYSQTERVEPDKAGRIRVPERLAALAGIDRSVVILGIRDHLELRSPEDWERRRAEKLEKMGEIMVRASQSIRAQNTTGRRTADD